MKLITRWLPQPELRATICLHNSMPVAWAGGRHCIPESKDKLSYFQWSFPVFPNIGLEHISFFLFLELTFQYWYFSVPNTKFLSWNLSLWCRGRKEMEHFVGALPLPHDNLSWRCFLRGHRLSGICCRSETQLRLITTSGWAYLRVSSAPDRSRVGLASSIQTSRGLDSSRQCSLSGSIVLSAHILTSVWPMSLPQAGSAFLDSLEPSSQSLAVAPQKMELVCFPSRFQ